MQGVLVLKTMEQAQAQGFVYFDKTADGCYLVRKKLPSGWALAIVRNN